VQPAVQPAVQLCSQMCSQLCSQLCRKLCIQLSASCAASCAASYASINEQQTNKSSATHVLFHALILFRIVAIPFEVTRRHILEDSSVFFFLFSQPRDSYGVILAATKNGTTCSIIICDFWNKYVICPRFGDKALLCQRKGFQDGTQCESSRGVHLERTGRSPQEFKWPVGCGVCPSAHERNTNHRRTRPPQALLALAQTNAFFLCLARFLIA
jgi:hypothetical protein